MSNNFDFASAIEEGLRLGKERLEIKDRINEILNEFANDLQKILSQNSLQNILVQKRHLVVREKGSTLAALAGLGLSERAIKEEYDAVCLFNEFTRNDPFVVFRYEIDPVKGFPCKIQYARSSLSCKDETALIETIKEAIKYKGLAISEKVRELMNNSEEKGK